MNTTPPTRLTFLTEILRATSLPQITANPVVTQWHRKLPNKMPHLLSFHVSTTVANWDRSPHSPTHVMVKACAKICAKVAAEVSAEALLSFSSQQPISGSSINFNLSDVAWSSSAGVSSTLAGTETYCSGRTSSSPSGRCRPSTIIFTPNIHMTSSEQ